MSHGVIYRQAVRSLLVVHLFRLRWKVRKKLDVLEKTISSIEAEHTRALKHGAKNFAQVYDASPFLTLLSFDLTVLQFDQACELRTSRKNLYSRQLCLLLFEALEDLPNVFGKKLRAAQQGIADDPQVLRDLGRYTKSISNLSKNHSSELGEIRKFAAAHREKNALLQLQVIRKVDVKKVGMIAKELDDIIRGLVLWLIKIGQTMGQARVILRNIQIQDKPEA